jgi:KaiC/GvpD/RAD55 family RecA-like ATPase
MSRPAGEVNRPSAFSEAATAETKASSSCRPLVVVLQRTNRKAEPETHLEFSRPFARCHILVHGIDLGILGELAPGGFHYGMTCLVEFEPHSLWNEASLTITAEALKKGIKTEYHVFQHTPREVRSALKEMGVDIERYEARGIFRIMDTYTSTTPLAGSGEGRAEPLLSGRVPDAQKWADAIRQKMKSGFEPEEKRWLHIDDNEAVLLQFSDEEYIVNGWRTTFVPMAKARELLILHALVTGVASDAFYRKREALADAVIDIKTLEEGRRLEHYIRLRALRGVKFDSSWRRIELFGNNRVRLSAGKQVFGFQSAESERIFNYLLKSFISDHFIEKHSTESSGWRSLVEIAQGIGVGKTSLYSVDGSTSLRELSRKGVVERKVLHRQRGRGGRVSKTRIAYERGFVKEYVDRYIQR